TFSMATTTDARQLAGECKLWLDTLRSFRNKFQNHKTIIAALAHRQREPEVLLEIEHLDNQLYIQLINIHDLKQQIKGHMQRTMLERAQYSAYVSDYIYARHEFLNNEYHYLESTLHMISREFDHFIRHVKIVSASCRERMKI